MRHIRWLLAGGVGAALLGVVALDQLNATPVVGFATVGQDPYPLALDDLTHRAFVYNRTDGTVSTIDTVSGAVVDTVTVGSTYAWMATDQRTERVFVSSGGDDSVTMLDARNGRVLRRVTAGNETTVRGVAVDEASGHVFLGHRDIGVVTMLDARDGRILRRTPVCASPFAVAVAVRTHHVFVQCTDGDLTMLDTRTGRALRTTTTGNGFSTVLADEPTGRVFIMDATRVVVLDARTAAVVRIITNLPTVGAPVVDPHTGRVFVSLLSQAAGGGTTAPVHAPIVEFDGRTGAVVRQFGVPDNPDPVAVDPRTGHLLVGSAGPLNSSNQPRGHGVLSVLDPASGSILQRVPLGIFPSDMAIDAPAGRVVVDNETTDLNILTSGSSNSLTTSPPESGWQQLKRHALETLKHVLPSWVPVPVLPPPSPPSKGTVTTLDLARL